LLKWIKGTLSYLKVSIKLEKIKIYVYSIYEIIKNQVKVIRNTYNNGSLLSGACKDKYEEIIKLKDNKKTIKKDLYEKLFKCIEDNLN
jgi:hypothetical protein